MYRTIRFFPLPRWTRVSPALLAMLCTLDRLQHHRAASSFDAKYGPGSWSRSERRRIVFSPVIQRPEGEPVPRQRPPDGTQALKQAVHVLQPKDPRMLGYLATTWSTKTADIAKYPPLIAGMERMASPSP